MFPKHSLDESAAPSVAGIAREETGDGRLIVQFLVDAAQGKVPGARPCRRRKAQDKTRTILGHFGDILARARYGGRDVTVSPAGASQVCDVPKCPQMSQKIGGVTFCPACPELVEGASRTQPSAPFRVAAFGRFWPPVEELHSRFSYEMAGSGHQHRTRPTRRLACAPLTG